VFLFKALVVGTAEIGSIAPYEKQLLDSVWFVISISNHSPF